MWERLSDYGLELRGCGWDYMNMNLNDEVCSDHWFGGVYMSVDSG